MGDVVDATGRLVGMKPVVGVLAPGGIESAGGYSVTLNYNYGAFPLLFQGGGLMKSHLLGVNGTYGLTGRLTATGGDKFFQEFCDGREFQLRIDFGKSWIELSFILTIEG